MVLQFTFDRKNIPFASMEPGPANTLFYKRSHFVTRLPLDRLYCPSHYWLYEHHGVWRIGFTKFATHLLGEIVDYGFEIQAGAAIRAGQIVGWIEGFKALSDLVGFIDGQFGGANAELSGNPEAIDRDCYGNGWLYEATGNHNSGWLDAHGYQRLLDDTIDKLVEKQRPPE